MSFIRVTDKQSKVKIDLNTNHIIGHTAASDGIGSRISLINGDAYEVVDTGRSLRGYIKKAQGTLPESTKAGDDADD